MRFRVARIPARPFGLWVRLLRYLVALVLETAVAILALWVFAMRWPEVLALPALALTAALAWVLAYLVTGSLFYYRYRRQLRAAQAIAAAITVSEPADRR